MSDFGWEYPAGVSTLPGEEDDPMCMCGNPESDHEVLYALGRRGVYLPLGRFCPDAFEALDKLPQFEAEAR